MRSSGAKNSSVAYEPLGAEAGGGKVDGTDREGRKAGIGIVGHSESPEAWIAGAAGRFSPPAPLRSPNSASRSLPIRVSKAARDVVFAEPLDRNNKGKAEFRHVSRVELGEAGMLQLVASRSSPAPACSLRLSSVSLPCNCQPAGEVEDARAKRPAARQRWRRERWRPERHVRRADVNGSAILPAS